MDIPRTQPEEHDRVELVNVWDKNGRKHEEEQDVTEDEVRSEEAHFRDLAEEFTAWL